MSPKGLWCYWEVVDPLTGGAWWEEVRSLGGVASKGKLRLWLLLLFLLPAHHEMSSSALPHGPTIMYCAATDPKAMEPKNHRLKPLKP